jgi:hypothetical protein
LIKVRAETNDWDKIPRPDNNFPNHSPSYYRHPAHRARVDAYN